MNESVVAPTAVDGVSGGVVTSGARERNQANINTEAQVARCVALLLRDVSDASITHRDHTIGAGVRTTVRVRNGALASDMVRVANAIVRNFVGLRMLLIGWCANNGAIVVDWEREDVAGRHGAGPASPAAAAVAVAAATAAEQPAAPDPMDAWGAALADDAPRVPRSVRRAIFTARRHGVAAPRAPQPAVAAAAAAPARPMDTTGTGGVIASLRNALRWVGGVITEGVTGREVGAAAAPPPAPSRAGTKRARASLLDDGWVRVLDDANVLPAHRSHVVTVATDMRTVMTRIAVAHRPMDMGPGARAEVRIRKTIPLPPVDERPSARPRVTGNDGDAALLRAKAENCTCLELYCDTDSAVVPLRVLVELERRAAAEWSGRGLAWVYCARNAIVLCIRPMACGVHPIAAWTTAASASIAYSALIAPQVPQQQQPQQQQHQQPPPAQQPPQDQAHQQ